MRYLVLLKNECLFSCKCGFREGWDFFWSQNWSVEIWCPDHIPKLGVGPVSVFFIGCAAYIRTYTSKLGPNAWGMRFQKRAFFSLRSFQISFRFICKFLRNDNRFFLQKRSKVVLCNRHFINQNFKIVSGGGSLNLLIGNTCFMGNNGASISVIPHLTYFLIGNGRK